MSLVDKPMKESPCFDGTNSEDGFKHLEIILRPKDAWKKRVS